MFMNEVHWEIDKKLRDNLQVFVYPNMSEKYEKLFCKATELIAPHVDPHNITVYFTRKQVIIELASPTIFAQWLPTIYYNLDMIDTKINDERNLMIIFLEELVHAYFFTNDEVWVGKKVAELYTGIKFNEQTKKYELL